MSPYIPQFEIPAFLWRRFYVREIALKSRRLRVTHVATFLLLFRPKKLLVEIYIHMVWHINKIDMIHSIAHEWENAIYFAMHY